MTRRRLGRSMDDEGDEVDLKEGMPIANEDGERLGTLAALLVADDEEDAEFFLVRDGANEHLVPFDAVLGVGEGDLVVDVPKEALSRYPKIKSGVEPTDAEIDLAYDVYEDTASYESADDEEE